MRDRRAVGEIDTYFGRRVGDDHEVPGRAEGGAPDRPERRHHQIAAGPADALLQPYRQLARRESLAPCQARDVASRDEDELFPDHAAAKGAYWSSSCRISSRLKSGISSSASS